MSNDLISQLAQTSIVGLLLAISVTTNFYLYRQVNEKTRQFVDYLLAKSEKDGELKNQLLTFMQTMTSMMTQSKK